MKKALTILLGIWILSSCSNNSNESATNALAADSIYRPAYHFSTNQNWLGHPISLVTHNDQYHLFYQYNPDGTEAESDSWGHAVSDDMMLWSEIRPIDEFSTYQQGSVVSDAQNTSLLGQNVLIAIASESDEINLHYSNDGGNNWTDYSENPVLDLVGTPKVTWFAQTNQWIMTLTNNTEVTIFSSDDLTHWSQESQLTLSQPAVSSELFTLSNKSALLLNRTNGIDVLVGDFDGSTFSPFADAQPLDFGSDNSAGTVMSLQDRSIYIGWMNNERYSDDLPTKTWNSSLTFPRSLSLNPSNEILGFPIDEINTAIKAKRRSKLDLLKSRGANWYSFTTTSASEGVEVAVLNPSNERFQLSYDQSSFTIDRSTSGFTDFHSNFAENVIAEYPNLGDTIRFDIFIDHSSIEVFINKGLLQFSSLVFPQTPYSAVELKVGGEKRNLPAIIYDIDMFED